MSSLENSISTHVGWWEGKAREARGRQSDHKLRRLGQCPRYNTMAAGRNQQGLGGLLGASGRPQQSSLHWPGQAERCSLPPVTAIFLPPGKTTPTIGQEAEARRAWSLERIQLTGTKHCPPLRSCKYDQRPQLFHSPELTRVRDFARQLIDRRNSLHLQLEKLLFLKQRWWCMPIALELGSQGHEGAGVLGQPELA